MREHEAEDLMTRSAVMVARAAATGSDIQHMREQLARPDHVICYDYGASKWTLEEIAELRAQRPGCEVIHRTIGAIREVSASDAALARAIDAVPGRG